MNQTQNKIYPLESLVLSFIQSFLIVISFWILYNARMINMTSEVFATFYSIIIGAGIPLFCWFLYKKNKDNCSIINVMFFKGRTIFERFILLITCLPIIITFYFIVEFHLLLK